MYTCIIMRKSWLMSFLIILCTALIFMIWRILSPELSKNDTLEVDRLIQSRLDTLALMQVQYCRVNGQYADNFKALFDCVLTDSIPADSITQTPPIPVYQTVFGHIPLNIEKYQLLPPADTDTFLIFAGHIPRKQNKVPVFEISEPFDRTERPAFKVGDKNNTNTNGNWK